METDSGRGLRRLNGGRLDVHLKKEKKPVRPSDCRFTRSLRKETIKNVCFYV